jgi:hypothetical protein
MQSTKDTFYITLRDSLAALYPTRTINLNGQERPAIVVPENEPLCALTPPAPFEDAAPGNAFGSRTRLANCFFLHFGAASEAANQTGCPTLPAGSAGGWETPLMQMNCTITYSAVGTPNCTGADRGRTLAELDSELLAICAAGLAAKLDYTQSPPAPLGTNILWTRPVFADSQSLGAELRRIATITIFFYPD